MCTYRCMYVFTQYTHAHMLVHTCAQLYYKLWLGSSHRINAFLSLFTCIELCHHGLVVDACELAHFSCMWLGTCLLAFVSSTSMFQVSLRGLNSSTVMRLLTILTPFSPSGHIGMYVIQSLIFLLFFFPNIQIIWSLWAKFYYRLSCESFINDICYHNADLFSGMYVVSPLVFSPLKPNFFTLIPSTTTVFQETFLSLKVGHALLHCTPGIATQSSHNCFRKLGIPYFFWVLDSF